MKKLNMEVPSIGGRMEFVITRGSGNVSSRSEHPSCTSVKRICTFYYLDKIKNPMEKIFPISLDDIFLEAKNIFLSRNTNTL